MTAVRVVLTCRRREAGLQGDTERQLLLDDQHQQLQQQYQQQQQQLFRLQQQLQQQQQQLLHLQQQWLQGQQHKQHDIEGIQSGDFGQFNRAEWARIIQTMPFIGPHYDNPVPRGPIQCRKSDDECTTSNRSRLVDALTDSPRLRRRVSPEGSAHPSLDPQQC